MPLTADAQRLVESVSDTIENFPGIWGSDYPKELEKALEIGVTSEWIKQIEELVEYISETYKSWLDENGFMPEEGLYCLADASYGQYADEKYQTKILTNVNNILQNVPNGVEDKNGIADNPYFDIYGTKIYIYDRGPMRKIVTVRKYLDNVGVGYIWNKAKTYVGETSKQLKLEMENSYRLKGSVSVLNDLKAIPKDELRVGDVYNVEEDGMNYAWTGDQSNEAYDEGWDPLGGFLIIPTLTIEDIDNLLSED